MEPKIKLLIFTPTLQCGGSEKFVSILCNHINTDRFDVGLVVLDNSKPFYIIRNKRIELIELKKKRVRSSLFHIRRTVRQFRPDIVLSTANHLNLYFAIFRKWFPKRIRFIARESSIVSINSERAKMPKLYNWLIRRYYKRFDHIICQSAYMQNDLVQHYHIDPARTTVVYNAVEMDLRRNKEVNVAPDRTYKLITIARLSEEKGIERLIHAVGLLSQRYKFYIIGEGEKRNSLEKLIKELHLQDKVLMPGQRENPFTAKEDADLYLMGSYYEGLPNSVIEAQAFGIPVIAFNCPGGISEIITDGENGLLVDDNDIIGFAAAVKRSLSRNFGRSRIIDQTQKRFFVDTIMSQIEKILLQGNKE